MNLGNNYMNNMYYNMELQKEEDFECEPQEN